MVGSSECLEQREEAAKTRRCREIVWILALTGWEALAEFGLRTLGGGVVEWVDKPKASHLHFCVIFKQHHSAVG